MRTQHKGFTLIELMIVVAIIGIIAAIAYPNYTQYVLRSHRNVAEGDLMAAANAMERYYTTNNSYSGAAAGTEFPATSPFGGGTTQYNITLVTTASSYTITATPTGHQANDSCGTLTLDSTGAKTPTTAGCW